MAIDMRAAIGQLIEKWATAKVGRYIPAMANNAAMILRMLSPCGQKIKTAGKTRGYPIPA
jgi:hypothetical protein